MADEIVASGERGKWHGVCDELTGNVCITNPAGTKYEISAPRLAQLDRGAATLLNDMLDGLIDLQNENEALRARDELRDRAEGQADFGVVAQLEAAPPVAAPVRPNDSELEMIARAHGAGGWQTLGDMVTFARAIETAVLRANGFKVEGEQ